MSESVCPAQRGKTECKQVKPAAHQRRGVAIQPRAAGHHAHARARRRISEQFSAHAVGHALMGKAVGDKAEVLLPTGQTVVYTVLAITHSAN